VLADLKQGRLADVDEGLAVKMVGPNLGGAAYGGHGGSPVRVIEGAGGTGRRRGGGAAGRRVCAGRWGGRARPSGGRPAAHWEGEADSWRSPSGAVRKDGRGHPIPDRGKSGRQDLTRPSQENVLAGEGGRGTGPVGAGRRGRAEEQRGRKRGKPRD